MVTLIYGSWYLEENKKEAIKKLCVWRYCHLDLSVYVNNNRIYNKYMQKLKLMYAM